MKKIRLTLLLAVAVATAHAQVGFELGLNMANLAIKENNTSVPTKFKPGFAIGIPAGIMVSPHVYFEPGLFYDMTGCKLTGPPTGKYSINTITFPLNIEFKTGEKCGGRFFIGLGPFIGYNVGGSVTTDAYGVEPSTTTTLAIGTAKTDNLKMIEVGAGINFGYQLKKRIYARAHYQIGLTDLNPNSDGNNTLKSSAFGVTVGYLFGRCDPYRHVSGFGGGGGNHWRGMSKSKYSRKPRYERSHAQGY
jgi:hypothetical protein